MKRLVGMAAAVVLVAGLAGMAMAKWGGQGQGGACGDCPQQVEQGRGDRMGWNDDGRGWNCDGPRRDRSARGNARFDCDGPCNDGRGVRGSNRFDCDGPCGDRRGVRDDRPCDGTARGWSEGRRGAAVESPKVTLDEAKAQAKAYIEKSLKGATLKEVDETPRGRRFPHYVGTVEQDGRTYAIMIDAVKGGVAGLRLLPSEAPKQ